MRLAVSGIWACSVVIAMVCSDARAQDTPALPDIPEEDEIVDPAGDPPSDDLPSPGTPETEPPGEPVQPTAPPPLLDNQAPPPVSPAPPEPAAVQDTRRRYELMLRSRYLSVPRGLMDLFLMDTGDTGWPLGETRRPPVLAYTIGLEFAVLQKRNTSLGVYVEYIGSLLEEGYWDDHDNPVDGRDGDWLRPNKGFGGLAVAFNAFYDAPIVDGSQTRNQFDLWFYVGGGIGIVGIVGTMDQWELDPVSGTPAYLKAQRGDEPDGTLKLGSPVWPMVDFEMGFKMLIAEHVVLKLGGGLHDGLQVGGSLGARF